MTPADYLNSFLFGFMPYLALGVFLAGFIYRICRYNASVQATSTQFLSNDRYLRWGSNLFHFAILGVVAGHIFGLLAPEPLYIWLISNETKRMLAIIMGGLTGTVACIGIVLLCLRRFTNTRIRITSRPADFFIILLLLVQIILGLGGTYITAQSPLSSYMALDHWAQGIFIFQPDTWRWIAEASLVHKLHIIIGILILLIFPFTKLMHMMVAPVGYMLEWMKTRK